MTRGRAFEAYRFSYDMLGEAARTAEDAARYFDAYTKAIRGTPAGDGVSVKLSALHPRFEEAKRARVFAELAAARGPARAHRGRARRRHHHRCRGIGAARADARSFRGAQPQVARSGSRCRPTRSARSPCATGSSGCAAEISIRLVKGAYWDGEIKRAQQLGMPDYPVFTRKAATDVSYVACAQRLLSAPGDALSRLRHAQLPHRRHDPRARRRPPVRVPEALRHGRRALRGAAARAAASAAASMRR